MSRIPQLDALRGFALCGIVLANIQWFCGYAVDPSPAKDVWGLDYAVSFALHVFVDGKFYGLFSLLFGASFALMIDRERARGADAGGLARRRIASLGVLGVLHATLLWFGDILSLYAVAALPLWWILRARPRHAAVTAIALLASPALLGLVLAACVDVPVPALIHGPREALPAFAAGSAGALLDANADFLAQRWVLALASGRLPRLLGSFVLGALLIRHRPTFSRRGWVGLVSVAVSCNVALGLLPGAPPLPPSTLGVARIAVECVAIPTGALVYAGLGGRLFARPSRWTSAFAAAGRLSLTHYLAQSLMMAGIFYGVGLGHWGRLGAAESVAAGLGIACVQVGISPWIRARWGVGPGERALRWLSGRRRPSPLA
ncbi:MAG: DUF418 domain-containing protein [Nannocystaceae bacterium]|nr:DUF418 domain-containing protein [bacterium]